MTDPEAATLVAYMVLALPKWAPTTEAAQVVWVPRLRSLDLGMAQAAANTLIDTDEGFPAWSRFRSAYLALVRRVEASRPALGSAERTLPPEKAQQALRDARQALKRVPLDTP